MKWDFLQNTLRRPVRQAEAYPPNAEDEYAEGARKALRELQSAERYFNAISDPELVEYALYEIEASRRKYEYMMRKLRSGEAAYEAPTLPPQVSDF